MSLEVAASAAVDRIMAGGLIGYPTETVWGLGADARSQVAVDGLRRWKGRGDDHPISLLVAGVDDLEPLGVRLGATARKLAQVFWPGPLTLVVPCDAELARGVAREDGAVGLRCSTHPVARELAERLARSEAGPLTATSLNRTGEPPARSRSDAEECAGELPLVEGPDAGGAAPSSVVDLSGPEPRLLRAGALPAEDLAAIVGSPL